MKIRETILALIFLLSFTVSYAQSTKLCNANFVYTIKQEISPLTYQFIDSSTSLNTIIKWEWSFGNGETSLKQNPEHQYLNSGVYIVSLKVTDQMGLTDVVEDTIHISDYIPPISTAFFTYILDTLSPNFTYRFFDQSIHPNDSIILWTWNFGDGTTLSHLQNPMHQFYSIGTYMVSLSISTASNSNSSYSTYITISNGGINCDANFTYAADTNSSSPYTILFHDNSLHIDPILSWTWYFGDGDSSTYQDPSHNFPYAGIYNVKLKITSANCNDEINIPIQVANPQKYNLWGRVYVGNLTTDQCIAYLYRDYQNNHIETIDTVKLTSVNDTLGVYYFYQIYEGNLKVKVVLPPSSQFASSFAPTYYNSSPLWQFSQNISLFHNLGLQNVIMQALQIQIGTNYIEGTINNQSSGQNKDVLVLLENSQNDIINYTFTDSNGHYSFSQVPQGQFYIYGDLPGYSSSPATGNFASNNDSLHNVDLIISTGLISANINQTIATKEIGFDIYPNPISEGKININIHKNTDGVFSYKIFNVLGFIVQEDKLSNASYIDVNFLKKGIYFLYINNSKGHSLGVEKIILR